jgi:hypothetical protein
MTINERIRIILDREKIQNKDLAIWLGMTNSRLSQKFKEGIWDSVEELTVIAEKTNYHLDWIITGKGEPKSGAALVEEPPLEMTDAKPKEPVNRAEFYQELIEKNSDYSLIPKAFINGTIYQIILRSQLEAMEKTREKLIESKDKSISLLEKRIEELERDRAVSVSQGVKK